MFMTFDEFTAIAEEELALLPDYVHQELNGGVLTDPGVYLHPARLSDDLYILGTYSSDSVMGKQIVLYYGSFEKTMPGADEYAVRCKIRETLRHEFLHHMETRAGLFGKGTLIESDRESMRNYFMRKKRRIAVVFPGIGYHCDKPLLYNARKLARQCGYEEEICIQYSCAMGNIKGDSQKMEEAFKNLYHQAEEALSSMRWEEWDEILFVSKSIGTVIAAAYAKNHELDVKHVLYTPLSQTFLFHPQNGIAFIGSKDPWSDSDNILDLCYAEHIPITLIAGANHSLETGESIRDIQILSDVMERTKEFLVEKESSL